MQMQVMKKIAAAAAVWGVVLVGMSSASAAESATKAQQTQTQEQDQSQYQAQACNIPGDFCNTYAHG
jgi:hypothetical protein